MRNLSLKLVAVTSALIVGLTACGDPKPAATASAAGPDKSATAEASAAPTKNPCTLLTATEVEVVLGPLATPPFRSNGGVPDVNGDVCRYETPAFRAIELSVKWTDGGHTFRIWDMAHGLVPADIPKGLVQTSEGTKLTGAWDDARVMSCCKFAALHGAQLVTVDVSSSRATVEQAAKLAGAAVQRLDKPLSADATVVSKEAEEHAALRPKARSVCELLTRAEAEAIAGAPMSTEPVGNANACTYKWVQSEGGLNHQMKLSVSWRGGFGEMRFAQSAMGDALSFLKSEGLDAAQEKQSGGALDEDATNIVGVMAVRKDVMLSVETGGFMNDIAHAFVAKAASKL